jgi:hypothetical protein
MMGVLAGIVVLSTGLACDLILGIPPDLTLKPDGGGGSGGSTATSFVLREGRLATQPAAGMTAGAGPTWRVTHQAFETAGACATIGGERLCVRGGLTAAGTGGK